MWRRGFLYGKDGGKRPRHLSTRVAHPNAASDVADARVLEGHDAGERWEGTFCKAVGCKENAGKYCNGKSCWIPRREAPQSLKEKHPRAPSAMEQPHQKHFLLHDIPVPNRWLGVA